MKEWKPEYWKWNNWTGKGQQKGLGKKGKGEKKGKKWRAPSPQRQPAFASSHFDSKSTTPSLDSLRVKGFSSFFVVVGGSVILRILDSPFGNSSRNLGKFWKFWGSNVGSSSGNGYKTLRHVQIRGTADVVSVTVVEQQRWKDQWKFMRCRNEYDNSRNKRPSEKGGKGHGESHRPRVRIGESQKPVKEKKDLRRKAEKGHGESHRPRVRIGESQNQ